MSRMNHSLDIGKDLTVTNDKYNSEWEKWVIGLCTELSLNQLDRPRITFILRQDTVGMLNRVIAHIPVRQNLWVLLLMAIEWKWIWRVRLISCNFISLKLDLCSVSHLHYFCFQIVREEIMPGIWMQLSWPDVYMTLSELRQNSSTDNASS